MPRCWAIGQRRSSGSRRRRRTGEPVAIYGDYDVDGITGTAILTEALRDVGIDARPFIPHREREGYGLQDAAVARLAAEGARVLITADCGITALTEIATAQDEHGMDVVVLDHHETGRDIAARSIDRHAQARPERTSAVGAVDRRIGLSIRAWPHRAPGRREGSRRVAGPGGEVSTVADVVPLRGEKSLDCAPGTASARCDGATRIASAAQVKTRRPVRSTPRPSAFSWRPRSTRPVALLRPRWRCGC